MNITSLGVHMAKAIRVENDVQLNDLGTWTKRIEVETESGDLFEITLFSDEPLEIEQMEAIA